MTDKEQLVASIEEGYVQGIFNRGHSEAFRNLFHSNFEILSIQDNGSLQRFGRDTWLDAVNRRREHEDFRAESLAYRAEYRSVLIADDGMSATVAMDLYLGDEKIYNDFLLALRRSDGWKLVSKVFSKVGGE